MGITPWEKANQRLGKTASLLKKHAGGWELMGMDGSHADGFCHAGGGGSNGIAAYRTDFRNGRDGKGKAWRCRIGRLSECNRFCMVPHGGEVQVVKTNGFFRIGRCGDE